MTTDDAMRLGYKVVEAPLEIGLVQTVNGEEKGVRTWYREDFDNKIPTLEHPEILETCARHQRLVEEFRKHGKEPL